MATSASLVVDGTPAFLSAGYSGLVDEVQVVGLNVAWVMDDVTFGAPTSTVPEPATILLLTSGIAALGAVRRRRGGSAL